MTHEEAVQKAVKLLRLATSSNENEAALAAAKAQEIIDRYKLDTLALEDTPEKPAEPEERIGKFDNLDFDGVCKNAPRCTWKVRLAQHVAEANQCVIYKTWNGLAICGRPSDVQTVRYMIKLIARQAWELTKTACKGFSDAYRNAYLNGAMQKVGERLYQMRREVIKDMQQRSNGLALVRVNNAVAKLEKKRDDVVDFMKSIGFKFTSRRSGRSYEGSGAFEQGYRDGDDIHISGAKAGLGRGTAGELN